MDYNTIKTLLSNNKQIVIKTTSYNDLIKGKGNEPDLKYILRLLEQAIIESGNTSTHLIRIHSFTYTNNQTKFLNTFHGYNLSLRNGINNIDLTFYILRKLFLDLFYHRSGYSPVATVYYRNKIECDNRNTFKGALIKGIYPLFLESMTLNDQVYDKEMPLFVSVTILKDNPPL